MAEMNPVPLTLDGRHVRLEPLAMSHAEDLAVAGADPSIWRYMFDAITDLDSARAYVGAAMALADKGLAVPFATIDKASGRAVGSTRFANIDRANRRLEIGWTWIAPAFQRTPVNTEAKYLQLRHCFETLHCIRVELKTDSLNEKSRAAILRLGAQQEGIFRNHMIMADGRRRHSVYFSIVDSDWPAVKARLEARLAA